MVLRSFVNFSKFSTSTKPSSSFIPRRTSSSSSASPNAKYPFFKPSYSKQTDLQIYRGETGKKGSPKNSTNFGNSHLPGSLYLSQKYIIFDQSGNNNNNRDSDDDHDLAILEFKQKILLKKTSGKNKNNHVNIFVKSIDSNKTTLNIRRSNSTHTRTLVLNNTQPQQARLYSTKNDLLSSELQKLHIGEEHQVEETKDKETIVNNHSPANAVVEESLEPEISEFSSLDVLHDQESIIDSMLDMGKNNEIMAIYLRLRGKEILPNVEIFNKVLKSIPLRSISDETIEEKLTHLLNVYSDMLSNNIKPNDETYNLVVNTLLKGSLDSYSNGLIQNGLDFFRISMELFLINNGKTHFPVDTYMDILKCLNIYQITNSITPMDLHKILLPIIDSSSSEIKSVFYQGLISFAKFFNDVESIEFFYSQVQLLDDLQESIDIYSKVVESLSYCGEFKKSSIFLDKIITTLDSKTQRSQISQLMSSYLIGLSFHDPYLSYDHLLRFNSNQYLPDISVESLLIMMKNFMKLKDLDFKIINKIWDFAVIRKDFDFLMIKDKYNLQVDQFNNYYGYIYNFLTNYVELSLLQGNKSSLIKVSREILIKESLLLEIPTLLKLVKYLNSIESIDSIANDKLVVDLIVDQSIKNERFNSMRFNKFISYIADLLTDSQMDLLFKDELFKRSVEEYRLTNDSIYGIMKIINKVIMTKPESHTLNLKYFAKVLDFEFNDTSNHYVSLPDEIKLFKSTIAQYV